MEKRVRIFITGCVQGVGCRPFIYRLANDFGLSGSVYNNSKGVVIEVQGESRQIDGFFAALEKGEDVPGWPALMKIDSVSSEEISVVEGQKEFTIGKSTSPGVKISQVTADSATCADCLREMNTESDFRWRYPFINCTNCGPRYSIVETIPYDRCNTTMKSFKMCEKCASEYNNPADRRFHAQPVACGECGPEVRLADNHGRVVENNSDGAIAETAKAIKDGKIAAIKGIGGFHLAVDATNEDAVRLLRHRKRRDYKPFAMMAKSVEKVRKFALVSDIERDMLESVESPIVLLKKRDQSRIAAGIAGEVNTFGFMLCYAPLHHLLFAEKGIEVLVMTSANVSDEPLICDNERAVEKLGEVADLFLMHNRDIRRQVDDSIVHCVAGAQAMLRRSRGFVPRPILRDKAIKGAIFAAGADMKNTFCLARGKQFIVSEHIGDLADSRVRRHYIDSICHLKQLFEVAPEVAACDLHPGYISTQYALSLGLAETIQVQHHWAHIASVLAEYDRGDEVIGLVADGTGLGTDGAVWGCECLIASLSDFERFGHLRYFPLAGGDAGAKEALRPVLGLLSCLSDFEKYGLLLEKIESDRSRIEIIKSQIEKNINTVETSSMGRLFDAVAAIAGLGRENRFDAELPMALESVIEPGIEDSYSVRISENGIAQLDFGIMLKQLIEDVEKNVSAGVISARFHNWAAEGLVEMAKMAGDKYSINTVALSGGVFCNRYLANRVIKLLKERDFFVLFKRRVPANDGGISLGQAAIAAELTKGV